MRLSLLFFATIFVQAAAEYCMDHFGDVSDPDDHDHKKGQGTLGFFIGVGLCLSSALCSVLGVMLQKKAHITNEKKIPEQRRRYVQLPIWWLGLSLVVLGAVLDFGSLGYAPQTVVASLGSTTLVINAMLAPLFLSERLSRLEIFGTLIITFGAAVAVSSSSHDSREYNLDVLICFYHQTGFVIYAVLVTILSVFCLYFFRRCEQLSKHNTVLYSAYARYHPIVIAALSGTLGAQSLLFAKGVSIILRGLYEGQDWGAQAFSQWQTYAIILAMVATVVSQTHTLNMALQRFDSVVVLPIFQVFWILMGVFGAISYYKEFDSLPYLSYFLFPLGILIIGVGIAILSTRSPQSDIEGLLRDLPLEMKGSKDINPDEDEIDLLQPMGLQPMTNHNIIASMRLNLHRSTLRPHRASVVSISGGSVAGSLSERMLGPGDRSDVV